MLERGKNERGVIEMVDTESLVPPGHLLRQVDTEELLAEVNADRETHGKKPLDDGDEPPETGGRKRDNTSKKKQARRKKAAKKQKTVTMSTTDPECGVFHKGEHKRCFAYEAHTACDKNGYVLEAVVIPGNVHDSVAFDDVYDKLIQSFPEVETVVADAAYKTPHICKKIFQDGRVLSTAYKWPMTMKGGHPWWAYVYDEYYDCVICPEYKDLYAKRKETIERVFADAKEKHAVRYTYYRGLTQVSNWVRLKFAAMNLKKLARWKTKRQRSAPFPPLSFYLSILHFAACLVPSRSGRFSTS